jgi:hypothetical protein
LYRVEYHDIQMVIDDKNPKMTPEMKYSAFFEEYDIFNKRSKEDEKVWIAYFVNVHFGDIGSPKLR